jgi:hypothetical protein
MGISFVWILWVQYATDNLSGNKKCLLRSPMLISECKINSCASYKHRFHSLTTRDQLRSYWYVDIYSISRFVEGFRNHTEPQSLTLANTQLHHSVTPEHCHSCTRYKNDVAFQLSNIMYFLYSLTDFCTDIIRNLNMKQNKFKRK